MEFYSLYTCDVNEQDYERFELVKRLLLRISEVENSALTVYDLHLKKYLISCERFDSIIGQKLFYYDSTDPEPLFRLMHPDDIPFVTNTIINTFEFLNGLQAEERAGYKLILDFRLRSLTGQYMKFIQQIVVLEPDRKGKIWLILKIIDLLAADGGQESPQRKLINMKTGKLCLFADDKDQHAGRVLSGRETEILGLISQGLDSKKISERLFISINTVNNHRQNILLKTKTENTTQALLYAKKIGIV